MKVYIAGPLFNEMERERNTQIKKLVEELGFETYLPQDRSGLSYNLIDEENKSKIRQKLFKEDVEGVKNCDIFLCLLDGRVPDEGTCVELGMAYILGKLCIGYKTDKRAMDINGDNNIMIDGCIPTILMTNTLARLKEILSHHL